MVIYFKVYRNDDDPKFKNTQKYFHHSNVKRYEVTLLRSGYLKPFDPFQYEESVTTSKIESLNFNI